MEPNTVLMYFIISAYCVLIHGLVENSPGQPKFTSRLFHRDIQKNTNYCNNLDTHWLWLQNVALCHLCQVHGDFVIKYELHLNCIYLIHKLKQNPYSIF